MRHWPRHYIPLTVLSDGNDTSCVNAASADPPMEFLMLHFPWPGWDWVAISSYSRTEVRYKLVMDVGLECEAHFGSTMDFGTILASEERVPEVYVYTTDQPYDPLPVDPSFETFQRCRVYQKEVEGNDARICFFKCSCPSMQCHGALVYVPDKTLGLCELSVVP